MTLSNTATPKYYGKFRDAVMQGKIPVNKEISMEMNRIDSVFRGAYFRPPESTIHFDFVCTKSLLAIFKTPKMT